MSYKKAGTLATGLRAMGVRGIRESFSLSLRHCNRPDRLVLGSNVVADVHHAADLELDSRLLMSVVVTGAAHPATSTSRLSVAKNATLRTTPGGRSRIGPGSNVSVEGEFVMGDSFLNGHAQILAEERISIGEGCAIAWNVTLIDSDRHQLYIDGEPATRTAPITIEDGAWIGHDVIVKKGVTVGSGAVVASGSVVTKDVPPKTLVAGSPAVVKADDVHWD